MLRSCFKKRSFQHFFKQSLLFDFFDFHSFKKAKTNFRMDFAKMIWCFFPQKIVAITRSFFPFSFNFCNMGRINKFKVRELSSQL